MTSKSVVFSETLLKEFAVGKNSEDMLEKADLENDLGHGDCIWMSKDPMKALLIHDETTSSMKKKSLRRDRVARIEPLASRFILDCLGYLPVEFYHFAADILLTGVKLFVKNAPSAILDECEQIEQRLMLHRVGMSLGIVERSQLDFSKDSTFMEEVSSKCHLSRNEISLFQDPMRQNENGDASFSAGVVSYVPFDNLADSAKQHSCELESSADRAIETIQREEFGLQPDLSLVESAMLNKQHARLGRALDCLSQELYSLFILDLVQNADDNIYFENVEPTLTFILQDKGMIVLNNERGFSADNIRALCDVGNLTKKGCNAGYTGKKGIGFKSVFRVTDAPEIHSNGFHIKFDMSNGQIGFVLPTVVPPCDIDSNTRLASLESNCVHCNTCIVLPFRSTLLETSADRGRVKWYRQGFPWRGEIDLVCGIQGIAADTIRPDISKTEISMAFTLQETLDGSDNTYLNQRPVFAFLPLRKYASSLYFRVVLH
ncbi:hypothetical protein KY285_037235 [Solanum tuberosum]|nr:hypothetical protein KY285_037235 [Solanum tuberosum]